MRKFLFTLLIIITALFSSAAYSEQVYRIGVMRFENKAPNMSSSQAEAITDIFIRMLASSKKIAVLERERLEDIAREHRFSMSGLVDANTAVQIGRIAGCQFMILGSVTQFDSKQSSQSSGIPIPIFGVTVQESKQNYEANVTIDMRVVNVETTEIVLSMSETGNAVGERNASSVYWGGYGNSGSNTSSSITGIESKAVEDAVTKLGVRIREEVSGEYAQVLSAGGSEITLSVGATSGARKGAIYKVYADGAKVFDMDGNELGSKQIVIAAVEITDVQNNFSTGKVNKGWGNASLIRRGDKIAPISSGEVRDLVKKKAFAKSRPHTFDSDIDISGLDNDSRTPAVSSRPSPSRHDSDYDDDSDSDSRRGRHPNNNDRANRSTDPSEVIATYDLSSGEINSRRIAHINANKLRGQRAYNKFVELAESYDGDYLAAFRAGELAKSLRRRREAREWFERALEINPDYVPAKRALDRM